MNLSAAESAEAEHGSQPQLRAAGAEPGLGLGLLLEAKHQEKAHQQSQAQLQARGNLAVRVCAVKYPRSGVDASQASNTLNGVIGCC